MGYAMYFSSTKISRHSRVRGIQSFQCIHREKFRMERRFQNDRPAADQNELNPDQKVDPTGLSI
jgi:hypothetical protein